MGRTITYIHPIECQHCHQYTYMNPLMNFCNDCIEVEVKCEFPGCDEKVIIRRADYENGHKGFCKNHINKTYKAYCPKCNEVTNHKMNMCFKCHNSSEKMRESSARIGKETIKYAIAAHDEYTGIFWCETCQNFTKHVMGWGCITCHNRDEKLIKTNSERLKEAWKDPEYANKIASNLGNYLGNPEWARIVGVEGRKALAKIFEEDPTFGKKIIQKAIEKRSWLWKNDPKWVKEQKRNITKSRKLIIKNFKINFKNFKLNSIPIKNEDIRNLKQNDICGAYVLKAKFKGYIGTERKNEVFKLLPCKSKYIYDEMDWEQRVCSQPGKQDWIITEQNPWNIAKWWYISNLYYDFEFELLTDPNGVSNEEALYAEYNYADKNDLYVEFTTDEQGRRIPVVEKHAYWSP